MAPPPTGMQIDGHTVTCHGKKKKIAVPEVAPVITLGPASIKDLVAGAVIFMPAVKDTTGVLVAPHMVVGANGVVPPM